MTPAPDGYSFALCLTHDVDRPYKSLYHALYHGLHDRSFDHLRKFVGSENPYWQFEEIMALEDELGVRSSFYFLNEAHLLRECGPETWLRPDAWIQHLFRYDVRHPKIAEVIRQLDAGGWEVGLHGSYHSFRDPDRLADEKRTLEDVLGRPIRGGRQHYLRLQVPETWRYHTEVCLQYDASLGSTVDYGFQHGYDVVRPFDDEFVVFPLTAMEIALPDPGESFEASRDACRRLLAEAAENGAVMTVLWHPRFFNEGEFPGYRRLYRQLIEAALEANAWVGPPAKLYDELALGESDRGRTLKIDAPEGRPVDPRADA